MRGSIRGVVAVCLAAVLVTSACGDDPAVTADGGPASTTTAPAEGTTTTQAPGSSTTSPMGDARIVRATDLTPEPIPSPPDRLVELVEQTAEPLPLADRANLVPESEASDDPTTYVTTYLDKVMQNADAVWAEWMVRVGYQRPAVGYVVVQDGDVYQSNCIIAGQPMVIEADTPNAYYCPVDVVVEGFQGAIWMPVLTMYKMWNGDIFGRQAAASGDFAAAVLAAHEFGHHVADELAIQSGVAPPAGKWAEQIADCMAGVWSASVYYQGLLEEGDVNEAITALEAIGDSEGVVSHGTPQERAIAFTAGYAGITDLTGPGDPSTCIQTYWRQS